MKGNWPVQNFKILSSWNCPDSGIASGRFENFANKFENFPNTCPDIQTFPPGQFSGVLLLCSPILFLIFPFWIIQSSKPRWLTANDNHESFWSKDTTVEGPGYDLLHSITSEFMPRLLCGARVDVVLAMSAIYYKNPWVRDKRWLRMLMSNLNSFGYVTIIPAIKVSGKVIDNSITFQSPRY